MIATFIPAPPGAALCPLLLSRDELGDFLDYRHFQIGIDRQAENFPCCGCCYRQVLAPGRWQAAIHGEVGYQRIEIAACMDALVLELLVKVVPADRVVGSDKDREI